MDANHLKRSNVLLHNLPVGYLSIYRFHDIVPDLLLISLVQQNIFESRSRYSFGVLLVLEFPVNLNQLSELDRSCVCNIDLILTSLAAGRIDVIIDGWIS